MTRYEATKQYSHIRGFNYQPSYAMNSYEAWRFFDEETWRTELGRGKKYFPNMNTVRLWMSYDAFRYEEKRQAENFEKALAIADSYGLKVMPVLFNRWHDKIMDNGGIYFNQMVPGSCWCAEEWIFDSYLKAFVEDHAQDPRILLWDICNEPFSYGKNQEFVDFIRPYELAWLERMYERIKKVDQLHPVGISHSTVIPEVLEEIAHISDVFLIHPYYYYAPDAVYERPFEGFIDMVHQLVEVAEKHGKPVLTTETCWGSLDDDTRALVLKNTLEAHRECGLGIICHALHYSLVADLHDPEDGLVHSPGNLCFIRKDGSLRKGHEIFNDYE